MTIRLMDVPEMLARLHEAALEGNVVGVFATYKLADGTYGYCFNTDDGEDLANAADEFVDDVRASGVDGKSATLQ